MTSLASNQSRRAALLRAYRIGILLLIALLLGLTSSSEQRGQLLDLQTARRFFPSAQFITSPTGDSARCSVFDRLGNRLGELVLTSPETDEIVGYAGPSNVLIVRDERGSIVALDLISSQDTSAHVQAVKESTAFWNRIREVQNSKSEVPIVEAISGSTLTSMAIAESVDRRLNHQERSWKFPKPLSLEEIKKIFPDAYSFRKEVSAGWYEVRNAANILIGFVVLSSPKADNVRGYRGPSQVLLVVNSERTQVRQLLIRNTYDTPEYVDRVRSDDQYLKQLTDIPIQDWPQVEFAERGIEGVSGATQTSFAVAASMKRALSPETPMPTFVQPKSNQMLRALGLLAVVSVSLIIASTRARHSVILRAIWQVALVTAFLFWLGDLLSLGLYQSWIKSGTPLSSSMSVLLLASIGLLAPWGTRRQFYCQHVCPHGIVQLWIGRFRFLHVKLPTQLNRWFSRIPGVILVLAILVMVLYPQFDLANIEPFDGWVLKLGALVSFSIAVGSLVVSLFIPQAYCRFGCPTGEIFQFLRSGGSYDRFRVKDLVALLLAIAVGGLELWLHVNHDKLTANISADVERALDATNQQPEVRSELLKLPSPQFQGSAFGTTYSIRVRGDALPTDLQRDIDQELARIETTLSHWKSGSITSDFNSNELSVPVELPDEWLRIVSTAHSISEKTDGAYDITVGPLVQAWGFGPQGEISIAPEETTLRKILEYVGYEKLELDLETKTAKKIDGRLQVDLGSLLQGYSCDQLEKLLRSKGVQEFLIEVGGEMRAAGQWQIGIESPSSSSLLGTYTLANRSIATSSVKRSARVIDAMSVHHIISPKTGRPMNSNVVQATVAIELGIEADAWSTALLLLPIDVSMELARANNLTIWLVDNEGEVTTNAVEDER